jgi:hypothetical protein
MFVWTFVYAFLTFIAFITALFGGAYLLSGLISKDRSLIVFGLKAWLITVLAIAILYALLYHQIKHWFEAFDLIPQLKPVNIKNSPM